MYDDSRKEGTALKRLLLTAALLLMVGCTNDEATNDAKDLVDDADRGVEDLVDDTERGIDDAGDALTDDHNNNTAGDGMGPITDSPSDINGDGNPDVNGGVNGNGGMVDDSGNVNNNNEAVNEGKTNDAELQKKKND